MGSKWPYGCCFERCYFQDLFKTTSISQLAFSPDVLLASKWCSHTIVPTLLQLRRILVLFFQRDQISIWSIMKIIPSSVDPYQWIKNSFYLFKWSKKASSENGWLIGILFSRSLFLNLFLELPWYSFLKFFEKCSFHFWICPICSEYSFVMSSRLLSSWVLLFNSQILQRRKKNNIFLVFAVGKKVVHSFPLLLGHNSRNEKIQFQRQLLLLTTLKRQMICAYC